MAAAHQIPFACVPAGTRNHFALDVGVDRRDVTGALDAFTRGIERRIDTAEVNGRMFLNNVSLGIYGNAVRSPAYRDAKVRTLLEAAAAVMGPGAAELAPDLLDALGDSPGGQSRAWSTPRLEIDFPAKLHAAIDGEAADLEPPLRFAISPSALRVRISPHHPGASPSARLRLPGHPPA